VASKRTKSTVDRKSLLRSVAELSEIVEQSAKENRELELRANIAELKKAVSSSGSLKKPSRAQQLMSAEKALFDQLRPTIYAAMFSALDAAGVVGLAYNDFLTEAGEPYWFEWSPHPKGRLPDGAAPVEVKIELFRHAAYLNLLTQARSTLAAIERLLRGRAAAGPARVAAGGFSIVNIGQFDEPGLSHVVKAAEAVTQKYEQIGLGHVCYGKISVLRKPLRPSIGGLFSPTLDEIWVDGSSHQAGATLTYILAHEIGHRVHRIFHPDMPHARLYEHCEQLETLVDAAALPEDFPPPGTRLRLVHEGAVLGATVVKVNKLYPSVRVDYDSPTVGTRDVTYSDFMRLAPGYLPTVDRWPYFVTQYAKVGGRSENVAELFAVWVMGRLPPQHLKLLELAMKHSDPGAYDRAVAKSGVLRWQRPR
jgi:hypothetical protein